MSLLSSAAVLRLVDSMAIVLAQAYQLARARLASVGMGADVGVRSGTATAKTTSADGCTFTFDTGPLAGLRLQASGAACKLLLKEIRTVEVIGGPTYIPWNNPWWGQIADNVSCPIGLGAININTVAWSPNGGASLYGIASLDIYCDD